MDLSSRGRTLAEPRSIYRPPWRVDVTERPGAPWVLARTALVRAMVSAVGAAGAPRPASIGLILSDDRELAALNAEYMGVAGPTDVLSFPLMPPETFPAHRGRRPSTAGVSDRPAADPAFPRPPRTRVHLGDVVVSVERAIAQAEAGRGGWTGDVRWTPEDELRLLVIHGALHVCGWDHADPEEETAMRRLEAELLGYPAKR